MPLLQPTRALRASRALTSSSGMSKSLVSSANGSTANPITAAASANSCSRTFSTHTRNHAATSSGHDAEHGAEGDHYEPPTGWLWGIKPGEKYEKEGWEGVWVWGFFGSVGLGVVAYAFKPDTSIQTWALEEARRRLEVEGILKEPSSKS